MTSVRGVNVIQTPCCGALYGTPAYGSINLSAQEYWTDGRRVGSLFNTDGGLRHCQCGAYYLLKRCEDIETIRTPRYKPRAPKGWQRTKDNWWNRFWGKPTLSDYLLNYDIRTDEEIKAAEDALPPMTKQVADASMPDVIEQCTGDTEMLIIARRRWWQHLNEPFRELYRTYKQTNPDTFPYFQANDVQMANMLALIALLKNSEAPPWLELAELFREAGVMDAAADALQKADATDSTLAKVLRELMAVNYCGPARFRY
jgi:hypothetical protein